MSPAPEWPRNPPSRLAGIDLKSGDEPRCGMCGTTEGVERVDCDKGITDYACLTCYAVAMGVAAPKPERTHGYVIRHKRIDGQTSYRGKFCDAVFELDEAKIFTLAELSRDVNGNQFHGSFHRVRRVEGGTEWKHIGHTSHFGYKSRDTGDVVPFSPPHNDLFQAVPSPPRWEIDPEDDDG